jgi:hypothetical protein
MKLQERIRGFSGLGNRLRSLGSNDKQALYAQVASQNPWFTSSSIDLALEGVSAMLHHDALLEWTSKAAITDRKPMDVGVIMAGNIPMVGFHDLLCVLISGHHLSARFSSQDSVLMKFICQELIAGAPGFEKMITPVERLNNVEAVIATGSDNTARYFEYYFRKIPHIIRKNRSSCAVLAGNETAADFVALGHDVFSYYGLGCRNVSKLFVPVGYNFTPLLDSWAPYHEISNHHKYANNYDYNKAILLVNITPFLDTGYVLVTSSTALVSPISVVYYEEYSDEDDLSRKLKGAEDKIQCIVSGSGNGNVGFGQTQLPGLEDYADRVNTLEFLTVDAYSPPRTISTQPE